jgi:hypothetical protein
VSATSSLSQFVPPRLKLADVAGQEVTILSATIIDTPYGEAALLDADVPGVGLASVIVSAREPLAAIKAALTAKALPAKAVFVKEGRSWRVR